MYVHTKPTRPNAGQMLANFGYNFGQRSTTSAQHWVDVSCLLGIYILFQLQAFFKPNKMAPNLKKLYSSSNNSICYSLYVSFFINKYIFLLLNLGIVLSISALNACKVATHISAGPGLKKFLVFCTIQT